MEADINAKVASLSMNMPFAYQINTNSDSARAITKIEMGNAGSSYSRGTSALDRRDYEGAVTAFDRVIATKSDRADGAHYWKAYSLNKLGKRTEALAALAEIPKQFPQSRWINDAKALEVEVRQASGQPVSPEAQADEELKLFALNALINSDQDRAFPLIEKLLDDPKSTPAIKKRGLFVMAQNRSDKGREILTKYAKNGSNPDLQLTAVEYLGTYRARESQQTLADMYSSMNDVLIRRAILRGMMNSGDTARLVTIAKTETNLELRREALNYLGNQKAVTDLVQLYGSETDTSLKGQIISSLGNANAVTQLIALARAEKSSDLKRKIVERLSHMKSKEATDFLVEILN
jgi:tetratricopeptide (TPR) repeat protein